MLVLTPDNDPSPWYYIGYVKAHCDNLNGELQETDRTMLNSSVCCTDQQKISKYEGFKDGIREEKEVDDSIYQAARVWKNKQYLMIEN